MGRGRVYAQGKSMCLLQSASKERQVLGRAKEVVDRCLVHLSPPPFFLAATLQRKELQEHGPPTHLILTRPSSSFISALCRFESQPLVCFQLHTVMSNANMVMASQKMVDNARAHDFNMGLEVETNDENLETDFIHRFTAHGMEQTPVDPMFLSAAKINLSVVIYHRGAGQASITGFFLMEKIDIVLASLLDLLISLLVLIRNILSIWTWPAKIKAALSVGTNILLEDNEGEADDGEDSEVKDDRDKKLRRANVRQSIEANWMNLFKNIEKLEPTFKEMAIVYRLKRDEPSKLDNDGNEVGATKAWPIHVKMFKDVPIADFEVMLPEQRPVIRYMDAAKMVGTVLAGLAAVYFQLMNSNLFGQNNGNDQADAANEDLLLNGTTLHGTELDAETPEEMTLVEKLNEVKTTLIMLGSYIGKVFVGWSTSQKKYATLIMESVFEKFMDSGHGVRTFLMDAEHQQEFKEALLAYYFVWQGRAETVNELDDECEQFLLRNHENVDFEISDAVGKLTRDGLLHLHGPLSLETKVGAISLRRAIAKLDEIWKYTFDDHDIECPICPLLKSAQEGASGGKVWERAAHLAAGGHEHSA
jgi:hypothetical protein